MPTAAPHAPSIQHRVAEDATTRWSSRSTNILYTALTTVAVVLRNTALGSSGAWIFGLYLAQGSIFSTVSARGQSYALLMANAIGASLAVVAVMIIVMDAHFIRLRRRAMDPDNDPPPLWQCIFALLYSCIMPFAGTLALILLVVYLFRLAPPRIRPLKLEFFTTSVVNHLYACYVDIAAYRLIRKAQVAHRQKQQLLVQQQQSNPPTSSVVHLSVAAPQYHIQQQRNMCARYCRRIVSTSPLSIFVLVAAIYVMTTKTFLVGATQLDWVLFTCGSTLFKLGVQELAKWAVHKTGVHDIRTIMATIATPTVVIDTQIRLLLQLQQSQQSSTTGAVFMALIEIAMRVGKTWLVKLEVRHHGRKASRRAAIHTISPLPPTAEPSQSSPTQIDAISTTTTSSNSGSADRGQHKIMLLYMAEVYADMTGEYIAIGCSAAIMFFFSAHPKYSLAVNGANAAPSGTSQLEAIAVQVGLEIVVDVAACVFEIRRGIAFHELRRHGTFILLFFAYLAVLNMLISNAVYLSVDS